MAEVVIEVEEEGSQATAKKIRELEKALEKLKKQVEKISGEPLKLKTDSAEKEVKELRQELKRLEKSFDRAVKSVRSTEVALESAKRGIGSTRQATRRLADQNKKLVDRGKELIDFSKRLPPELRKVATGLDKVEKEAEQAERAFRKLSASQKSVTGLVQSIGQLRTGVGALVAALGVRQIIRGARAFFEYAASAVEVRRSFDSLIPALRGVTGSTELAKESAEFLDEISRRLKVSTGELIKPYTRLTAALRATNSELQLSDDVFEAVIESGAAFGLTAADINLALNAVVQVVGKGVASMEEFRRQLSERIPNAIPALAKGLGVTIPDAIKLVSSGSLEGAKAVEALAKGLTALNKEAAELQLDRLGKNLDNLDRIAEQARVAFADGFAPALNDTVKEIAALETELIAVSSLLGGVVGVVIEQSTKLALGFKDLGDTSEAEVGRAVAVVNGLAEAIKNATGLDLGEPFREFVADVTGLSTAAEKAFKDIEKAAKEAAIGTSESARETEERFRKAFENITKAAEVSAADREAIESELVKEIARVSEESVKAREALGQLIIRAATATAEERLKVEKFVLEALTKLEKEAAEARAEVLKGFVEAAKVAAVARSEAERAAAEESLRFFKEIAAGAAELTAARIAASDNASTKIEKIELELSIKLAELQEKVLEKLKEAGADRVKIEKETRKKISDLQIGAADAIVKELERIAAASKKAADKRIADEKRIQAELDKSIDKLKQLTEEIAATGEEDSEDRSKIGQLVEQTKSLVEQLGKAKTGLAELFVDPGTTIGDPGSFLEESFAKAEAVLGSATQGLGFYTDQLQAAGTDTEQLKDFTKQLEDAIAKVRAEFDNFGTAAKERLEIVLGGFEALVEGGQVTQESFKNFGTEVSEVLDTAGGSAEKAAGQVGALADKAKDLEGIRTAGEDAAVGIKELGDEAEATGRKVVTLADGTKVIVDDLDAFGTAASEAKEPVSLLAEPVEKIALGAKDLSGSLPGIVEQVGKLTPQLEALKKLLVEDPIDLPAIVTQLQEISTPLERIGTSLTAVRDAVVALPEPLEKIREPAKELLGLVAKAAEDGSFAQIATALGRIAKALPEIPEPIKAFLAALKGLSDLRGEIAQTLMAIADGLTEVGNETVLAALGQLETKLAEIVKDLGSAKTLTEEWRGTLDRLTPLLETASTNASTFAGALRSDLVPALESTRAKGDEAREAVEKLKDETGRGSEAFIKLGENSHATLTAMVADAAAAQAAMASLRAEIEATAAAAKTVKIPQS